MKTEHSPWNEEVAYLQQDRVYASQLGFVWKNFSLLFQIFISQTFEKCALKACPPLTVYFPNHKRNCCFQYAPPTRPCAHGSMTSLDENDPMYRFIPSVTDMNSRSTARQNDTRNILTTNKTCWRYYSGNERPIGTNIINLMGRRWNLK